MYMQKIMTSSTGDLVGKRFYKFRSEDQELNRVQEQIEQVLNPLASIALLDGALLENVDLVTATDKNIEHKLSRKYSGYIIVKRSAACDIFDKQSQDDTKFLTLNSSADVTVSIWVF